MSIKTRTTCLGRYFNEPQAEPLSSQLWNQGTISRLDEPSGALCVIGCRSRDARISNQDRALGDTGESHLSDL